MMFYDSRINSILEALYNLNTAPEYKRLPIKINNHPVIVDLFVVKLNSDSLELEGLCKKEKLYYYHIKHDEIVLFKKE